MSVTSKYQFIALVAISIATAVVAIAVLALFSGGKDVPLRCTWHDSYASCSDGIDVGGKVIATTWGDQKEAQRRATATVVTRQTVATRWDPVNQANRNQKDSRNFRNRVRSPYISETRTRHQLADPVGDSADFTNYENHD